MICIILRVDYKEQQRGTPNRRSGSSSPITTLPEHVSYFKKMAEPRTVSAVLCGIGNSCHYRIPTTDYACRDEEIRGVKSERVLQVLSRKGLIGKPAGRKERDARFYGTSKVFLDYFGLDDIEELPPPESIFDWQEWEQERQDC